MFMRLESIIRDYYEDHGSIPLHVPSLSEDDERIVLKGIRTGFVSTVGDEVVQFSKEIATLSGTPHCVPTVNGTAALHTALLLTGVHAGDYVITQPLSFVATLNSILFCGAEPVFVDIDPDTLSLSPSSLETWLVENAELTQEGRCIYRSTRRAIKACMPMHTFGHAARITEIVDVCQRWNITVIEDAAEALGTRFNGRQVGSFGKFGAFSFNGNKIITTGAGGAVLCDSDHVEKAKALTTTAKLDHPYEFDHAFCAYNYRMPNLNACLGLSQLKKLETLICEKRRLAEYYEFCFRDSEFTFFKEPKHSRSNYWLNAIVCESNKRRIETLDHLNAKGINARASWKLLSDLSYLKNPICGDLTVSRFFSDRIVNLPSYPKPVPKP